MDKNELEKKNVEKDKKKKSTIFIVKLNLVTVLESLFEYLYYNAFIYVCVFKCLIEKNVGNNKKKAAASMLKCLC